MRFLDTLSLHVCVAGQTTIQKALWKKAQSTKDHLGLRQTDRVVVLLLIMLLL